MANVWSMAKPTRKCILAGDIIYAFDRKVSSRTFDSLGRTFDSSGECLASLRSAKQLSPSESKVHPRESKALLSNSTNHLFLGNTEKLGSPKYNMAF